MEGMLKDLTVAKENEASFLDYLQNHALEQQLGLQHINVDNNVDLRVTVLTSIHWPGLRSFNHLTLPPEMVQCIQSVKDFYRTKFDSPKLLTWIHSLGACNVVGSFNKGAIKKVELQVSTLQAALLLLFNETERLSCREVKDKLNLGEEQIARRLLHSLSSSKYKILIASKAMYPVDGSLAAGPAEDDQNSIFEFNADFSSKTRRVKIPPPTNRDINEADIERTSSRKPNVLEDVETDRRYAVDACLVRIMKTRRVLAFQQLVAECVEQLRGSFKPDIKLIKKRMEDLITRDSFERERDDPTLCNYLA